MILRSVELQGCRCFRNPIQVGEFSDGVNLLVGANESGKSTIVEMVARAVFDRHVVGGAAVKALRPWGTNLSPEVALEFETDGERYRLRKRFLDGARAELEQWEAGGYQRIEEGDAVDERLRGLLLGEAPGRGLTAPAQWGVARTLWWLQRCRPDDLDVAPAVGDRVREALGATAAAHERALVGNRIEAEYAVHWTATGRIRAGSPTHTLLAERDTLRETYDDLDRKYREAEEYEEQLGRLQGEQTRLERELGEHRERAEALREDADTVRAIRGEIKDLQATLNEARGRHKQLGNARDEWAKADKALGKIGEELKKLDEGLRQASVRRAAAESIREGAATELSTAEEVYKQARTALDRCREILKARGLHAEEQTLDALIAELEALDKDMDDLEAQRDARTWPTRDDVQTARELETDARVKQTRLEAVGLSLDVELHRPQAVSFESGEQVISWSGEAGDRKQLSAAQEAALTLDGVATVRARSGARDPADAAAELEQTRKALDDLLMKFGADDAQQLADLHAEGDEITRRIKDARKEMRRLAADHKDLSGVRKRLGAVSAELDGRLGRLGLSRDNLPLEEPGDEPTLQRTLEQAERERDQAQERVDTCRDQETEAIETQQQIRNEQSDVRQEQARLEARKEALLQGVGCPDMAALQTALEQATAEAHSVEGKIAQQEALLPDQASDPEKQLETAQQAIESLEERRQEHAEQAAGLRRLLEQARHGDLYARRAQVEEELERKDAELAAAFRTAQGARLLRVLFNARREGTAEPLAGLTEKMERILHAVYLQPRRVHLDAQNLGIGGFWEGEQRGADEPHAVDEMSSGAREQLEVVYRLALGEVYAEKFGRQMLVLDDVLVYTDPERHERMLEILKIAAGKLQIIILTSRPQFYRGIVSPQHEFDIPALAREAVV